MDNSRMTDFAYMPDGGVFGLWVRSYEWDADQARELPKLITNDGLEEINPGFYHSPTARLDANQAAQLMQSLWDAGIRPTGWGHEGQVQALTNHLEDMRTLVFKEDR